MPIYQVVIWGKHIDFLKKACQELLGIILVKRSDLRLIKLLHVDEVAKHSPRFQKMLLLVCWNLMLTAKEHDVKHNNYYRFEL